MKRIVYSLVCIIMLATMFSIKSYAETGGTFGDNLNWSINESGILTISGSGAMPDYAPPVVNIPWYPYLNSVRSIVIDEGITYIGRLSFCGSGYDINLKSITFPKSLEGLSDSVFADIENVEVVYYNPENCKFIGNPEIASNFFPRAKKLVIGKSVKSIGEYVFFRANGYSAGQNTYKEIVYEGTAQEWSQIDIDYNGNSILQETNLFKFTNAEHGGTCGENLTWVLTGDGILTISGTGEMAEYSRLNPDSSTRPPWYENTIRKIIINEGVTSISNGVIYGSDLMEAYIPVSVKKVGMSTGTPLNENGVIYYGGDATSWIEIGGYSGVNSYYYSMYNKTLNIAYLSSMKPSETLYLPSDDVYNDVESATSNDISISVNNKKFITDQPPIIVNDRTPVPMRAILEVLGATVDWDETEQKVTSVRNGKTLSLKIGDDKIYVGEIENKIDVPAQIVNDRTMIPLRAVAENFDCTVIWNDTFKKATIIDTTPPSYTITASKEDGTQLGVATFENGMLSNLKLNYLSDDTYLSKRAFIPFYVNINGNSYMDIYTDILSHVREDTSLDFLYENGVLQKVTKNNDTTYSYEYNNGAVSNGCNTTNAVYFTAKKTAEFDYITNKVKYEYDNDWLITHYSFPFSGGSGSLTYDENGNIINFVDFGGFTYNYTGNKLVSSVFKESMDDGITINYVYSQN